MILSASSSSRCLALSSRICASSTAAASSSRSSYRCAAFSSFASSSPSSNDDRRSSQTSWRHPQRSYSASLPPFAGPSTAQLVKQLRESTGAPIMECKKALSDPSVNNDLDKAREWLRKHGSAKASSKVAGRETLEGLVGMKIVGGRVGSLVKVASETDFASRSDVFSNFVQDVAETAADNAFITGAQGDVEDIPAFLSTMKGSDGKYLAEGLNDAILAIRENLKVDELTILGFMSTSDSMIGASSSDSVVGGYVHGRTSPTADCGTAASIIELVMLSEHDPAKDIEGHKAREAAQEVAKKLAMHVVAAKPSYLNIESVPEEVVNKEKEILMEKMKSDAKNAKKPKDILEKIVAGQLRKFYEGVCLTEQNHMVEEGNPKVSTYLKEQGLEVKAFRFMGAGNKS